MNFENYILSQYVKSKLIKFNFLSYRIHALSIVSFILLSIFLIFLLFVSISDSKLLPTIVMGFIILFTIIYIYYKLIYLPFKREMKILQMFVSGYTISDLFDQHKPLSPEIEKLINKIKEMLNSGTMLDATKKQSQYLALQNQINPHFLYNTLEGIRSEALVAGLKDVAKMTETLGVFYRYTISNIESLVSLHEEIENVKNYYFIQKFRFGERLNLCIQYDEKYKDEIMSYKVPKLTLQPIVENSVYHGIERIINNGKLTIKIEPTSSRLMITISDNGIGMTEERLMYINKKLGTTSLDYIQSDKKNGGGIGILNVSNRIKLLYGEEYGIYIYSTIEVGTDVVITLPLIKNN